MFDFIKNLFCFKDNPDTPEPVCSMCKVYKPIITKDMGDEFCFTCVAKRAKEVIDMGKTKTRPTMNFDTPFAPSVQEDPRTVQSVKNVRKAFKDQQFAMDARARKAHSSECDDPWTCSSDPCFINSPDKIVSQTAADEHEVNRYKEQLKKNRKRLRTMKKAPIRRTI